MRWVANVAWMCEIFYFLHAASMISIWRELRTNTRQDTWLTLPASDTEQHHFSPCITILSLRRPQNNSHMSFNTLNVLLTRVLLLTTLAISAHFMVGYWKNLSIDIIFCTFFYFNKCARYEVVSNCIWSVWTHWGWGYVCLALGHWLTWFTQLSSNTSVIVHRHLMRNKEGTVPYVSLYVMK